MAVSVTRPGADIAGVNSSGNVATYSGANIGVAAADRVVVLCVTTELTSATITSATIDYGTGGALAMNAGTQATQGVVSTRTFYLEAPTGTTATFAVTFGANPNSTQNHVAVYRVVGNPFFSATNAVADTDADPISSGAITIPANGVCVASYGGATAGTARTWSGITEDLEVNTTAFDFGTGTSATGGTPTITVSGGNNEDGVLAWVIFLPAVNASANFAGSGGAAVNATVICPAAALIAGAGGFAIDATVTLGSVQGAALFSGSGNLASTVHLFEAGLYDETGATGNESLAVDSHTEFEFGVVLDEANLLTGDTLDFRVYVNGSPLNSYTVTPRVTALIIPQGAALLAGSGSLQSAISHTPDVAALFAGAGLAATATVLQAQASASFAGSGGLFTAASHTPDVAALFAGTGALASQASHSVNGAALLAGSGGFAADASHTANGAALFAGSGGIGASATIIAGARASFAGAGGLATSTTQTLSAGGILGPAEVLLLHFDGADGSTTFIDESKGDHTITVHGNAQTDTAQSVFGGSSLLLDGTGDWLSTTVNARSQIGTGDFTVDFRIRPNAWLTYPTIIQFGDSPEGRYFQLYIDSVGFAGTPGSVILYANGVEQLVSGFNPTPKFLSLNTTSHVALTRQAGLTRLFIDGTLCGSSFGFAPQYYVDTNDYGAIGSPITIGADSSGSLPLNAWADELRIVKGYAAWTSDFTPPASPYVVGDSKLCSDAQVFKDGAALLAGAGSLSVSAIASQQAAALFAGNGSIGVDLTQIGQQSGSASLAGAGGFTSAASHTANGDALLAGSGSIAVDAVHKVNGAARFAGTGQLSVDAIPEQFGAALLAGSGSLKVDATRIGVVATGEALFAGTGGLKASASHFAFGSELLDGEGLLSAKAILRQKASALLAGTSSLAVTVASRQKVSALFAGAGAFSAEALLTRTAAAKLTGSGSVSCSAIVFAHPSAKFAGVGSFIAQSQGIKVVASARLAGSGAFRASATHSPAARAKFDGLGTFAVDSFIAQFGRARFAGAGGLNVSTLQRAQTGARFQGSGALTVDVTPKPLIQISANLAGLGEFKAAATHTVNAAALFDGQGAIRVKLGIRHPGQAEPCRLIDTSPEDRYLDVSEVISVADTGIEDRYLDVAAEDRYLTVSQEQRFLTVEAELREANLPACGLAA